MENYLAAPGILGLFGLSAALAITLFRLLRGQMRDQGDQMKAQGDEIALLRTNHEDCERKLGTARRQLDFMFGALQSRGINTPPEVWEL